MKGKLAWIVEELETGITQIYFYEPDWCWGVQSTKIVYFEVEE